MISLRFAPLAALASLMLASAPAQVPVRSGLPPTPPTGATTGSVAPLAAVATTADHAGARHHRAQVNCAGGQLEVRADNSSLNGILRAISRCTGMKITGGVADQRVYGNYGPATPATVLATLLDGTETNVLLQETAADQPSELILTPRTGGVTPPNPNQLSDDDVDDTPTAVASGNPTGPAPRNGAVNAPGTAVAGNPNAPGVPAGQTAAPPLGPGAVSGPVSIPQPINNIMGSPNNTSPNAGTYPTTTSVPLDSLPTPSTTPNQSGIVSAPNPPAAGSDTAALLNGRTTDMPGNTTITDQPTSTATPGAAGTSGANGSTASYGSLTPQQVVDQLQRLRQGPAAPQAPPVTTPAVQPPQ